MKSRSRRSPRRSLQRKDRKERSERRVKRSTRRERKSRTEKRKIEKKEEKKIEKEKEKKKKEEKKIEKTKKKVEPIIDDEQGETFRKTQVNSKFMINGKMIYNLVTKKQEDSMISYYFNQSPFDPVKLYTLRIPNRDKNMEKEYKAPSSSTEINVCKGMYESDPVSMVDFREYEKDEYNDIYIDGERCFSLSSILYKIEAGFVAFDTESKRVLPLYPSDFSNIPFPPYVFRSIVKTAMKRGIKVEKEYPILYLFYNDPSTLLEAIYAFITQYRQLTEEFTKVIDIYAAVRRDIIAIDWMAEIYSRHRIFDIGYRKYTDIQSTNSHNGTQIFYQAIFVSYLVNRGLVIKKRMKDDDDENTDYYWTSGTVNNVTFRTRPVVRNFVYYKVIHK